MAKPKKPKAPPARAFSEPKTVDIPTAVDPGSGLVWGRDGAGNVYRLTPEEFAAGGYGPATNEDVAGVKEYETRAQRMGPGTTALVQLMRGASGGLIDVPASVSPEYAKNLQVGQAEHPVLSPASELVGMTAPLLIPGAGEGAAARMLSFPGAVEAAGRAAGEVAGGLGPVAGSAARWGTEGAAWMGAQSASDQALKGEPLDWDKIWSATNGGFLFAGALGGAFGSLGRFKAHGAAQRAAADVSAKGTAEEALANLEAEYGGKVRPEIRDVLGSIVGQPGKANENFLALVRKDPKAAVLLLEDARAKAQQELALEGAGHFASSTKMADYVLDAVGGPAKKELWQANLPKNFDPSNASRAITDKLRETQQRLDEMFGLSSKDAARNATLDQASRNRAAEFYSALGTKIDELEGLTAAAKAGKMSGHAVGVELASAGDMLKKWEQEYARQRNLPKEWQEFLGLMRSESDPLVDGSLASKLERSDLWGDRAAGMQRELNASIHEYLGRLEAHSAKLTTKIGDFQSANQYRNAFAVDPHKVNAQLADFGNPLNVQNEQEFRSLADSAARVGETLKAYKNYSPEALKELEDHIASARGMDGWISKASDQMGLINQARSIERSNPHTWTRIIGMATGGVLGQLTGIPGGALLGAGMGGWLGGALDPWNRIRTAISMRESGALRAQLSHEDSWASKALNRIAGTKWGPEQNAVEGLLPLSAGVKPASLPRLGSAARALLYNAFHEPGDKKEQGHLKTLQYLAEAASDPAKLRDGVTAALGDVAHQYPQAVDHYVAKIQRANAVLQAFSPTPPTATELMFHHWDHGASSPGELDLFEDIWEAVMQPKAALENASVDTLRPEIVDALDYVHPDYMAWFRASLSTRLMTRTKAPDSERLRQLSVLFNAPFAESMEPEYFDAMQDLHAARDQVMQQAAAATPAPRRTGRPTGVHLDYSGGDKLESELGGGSTQ